MRCSPRFRLLTPAATIDCVVVAERRWRARVRQFAPVALVALAPKGVCCLAAYAASGALFGRELCGTADASAATLLLPWLGGAVGGSAVWLWRHRREQR